MSRRSAVFSAVLLTLSLFSLLGLGANALVGPFEVNLSGLHPNLVIPLINATQLPIHRFVIELVYDGDMSEVPLIYVVGVENLGSSLPTRFGEGDLDGTAFDIDENRNWEGDYSGDNAYDNMDLLSPITYLIDWGRSGIQPGVEFQLRLLGDWRCADLWTLTFPDGVMLRVTPYDSLGAAILTIP